jgi:hypothetical protein
MKMKMKRLLGWLPPLTIVIAGALMVRMGPVGPWDQRYSSFEAALTLQEQVTEEWLARDGVVGTAIGMDGSGRAVVKVYLTAPGIAVFPRFVSGVQVVPEVTGRFEALPASAENVDPTRAFPRPVPIGVSSGHGQVTAGTLGARVTGSGQTYALSNNHVYAANNDGRQGDNLLQPGVVDGGRDPDDVIGTLHDYEPIHFCKALICEPNRIDAAIARTTKDDVSSSTPEGGYGSPRSQPVDAKLGQSVQKYGRTTGHTVGKISGINATIDVGYSAGKARFTDQIVITGSGFSAGGDSGSLIVTKGTLLGDRRPVGLLFAGTPTTTLANPIDLVLDRFDITIDGN